MKVAIVGGTGLIGGNAALLLDSKGYDVTLLGRHEPENIPALAEFSFIQCDFINSIFTKEDLQDFDVIVFSAGVDLRHVPDGLDADEFFLHVNGAVVPSFARLAREAGVKQFIHVGSYYHHVAPELVEKVAYLRSRKLASEAIAALATPDFSACSLDVPFIVGTLPGVNESFAIMAQYAKGKLDIPVFAPLGGVNFLSITSLCEAIYGAIRNYKGVSGKSFLVGDENLSFAQFFQMFHRAIGRDVKVEVQDKEHPLIPSELIYTGKRQVNYEISPEDHALLGLYRRNDIYRTVEEICSKYS